MSALEWIGLFAFIVAWFAQYFGHSLDVIVGRVSQARAEYRVQYALALATLPVPYWAFGLARLLVHGLNAGASFVYWRDADDTTTRYSVTLAFVLANVLLNKLWTPIFFVSRAPWWALIVLVLVIITTIVILVLVALDAIWLAFGLFVPYILWLLVALYLNWRFISELNALRRSNSDARQRAAAPVRRPQPQQPKRRF